MPPDPTAAQRQRARRRRLRRCLGLWRVEADVALADRLVDRGFLAASESDDRTAVEAALSRFVGDALQLRVTP